MSWQQVKLGDIFEIARGGSPRPIDQYITDDPNGLNWISIKDASNSSKYIYRTEKKIKPEGLHKTRLVNPDDFLLTNSMSFGRPYIMKTTGCIHDGWLVLSADKTKIDTDYFYHLFGSDFMYRKFAGLAAGAVVKNLNTELVKSVSVPLPPLAEQRRIASILDQADELRQKRQQAIEKLDQLLQATFIDMFGDPVSNPKGWDLKPVGEISESKLGKMLDKKKQSSENDQYKYLRNANVQWFRFDLSDVFEMEFNEKDRKNCELKFGDILVCEGGEPGRAAIWKNDLENCFFQKALHRVRLDMTQILPEYFVWLFWFYSKNGGFDDHITVATIAHLTGIKMKAMQIPIPPLSMQEEFQQKVNEIEVLRTILENSSKLFESLFSSLQNQAFSGNL
ncbi:restriction endonuclease subunit S [Acinetobacter tandoii]|uniref:restriction endonuclease subunit S n=1 Tax=Acinetobacter TaxID=469 RepID=UPI0008DD1FAD|nr:restriction endonuclease subunit S [Acinetobacter baumannii]MDV7511453.1 restriction endonuclease subunit S [Acinetobacter baumannii]MDV7550092.1 restriction endonuclease subunit S [Acinetobacter baumannii]OIG79972.1 restriction endonuclease [Acinetobacter baumannii]